MSPVFRGIGRELRSHGLRVKRVQGWKERGRPGTSEPRSFFDHHDASNPLGGNAQALNIITVGRSDLPGPLSNFYVGRDGTVYLVAAGRCNHAGFGGPHKGIPKDSGNSYAASVEIANNGVGEKYSPQQMRAVAVLNAVMLKRMKRTAFFAIGHKEWTPRKIDPSFDMRGFRKRVRKVLKHV